MLSSLSVFFPMDDLCCVVMKSNCFEHPLLFILSLPLTKTHLQCLDRANLTLSLIPQQFILAADFGKWTGDLKIIEQLRDRNNLVILHMRIMVLYFTSITCGAVPSRASDVGPGIFESWKHQGPRFSVFCRVLACLWSPSTPQTKSKDHKENDAFFN